MPRQPRQSALAQGRCDACLNSYESCRLEEMYDAQEGPDGAEEEDDSDFDPTGMVVTLTGSDLEASDWEEVHFPLLFLG